ncbi:hypothetical protein AB0C74_04270 [Spirillospora sp. NPDC048832]
MSADKVANVAIAMIIAAALLLPRRGKYGLRLSCAVVFAATGEGLLLSGAVSRPLEAALLCLSGSLLILAEIAAGSENELVPLLWIVCGGIGIWKHEDIAEWVATARTEVAIGGLAGSAVMIALALRGWRRATHPAYKSDDLTGLS